MTLASREREWLDSLKIGDTVVILGRIGDCVSTVERFTKTLIITKGGKKFRKDGGRERTPPGSIWNSLLLAEPTEERLATIRQAILAVKLATVKWKALSLKALREIAEIVYKESS